MMNVILPNIVIPSTAYRENCQEIKEAKSRPQQQDFYTCTRKNDRLARKKAAKGKDGDKKKPTSREYRGGCN